MQFDSNDSLISESESTVNNPDTTIRSESFNPATAQTKPDRITSALCMPTVAVTIPKNWEPEIWPYWKGYISSIPKWNMGEVGE